MRNSLAINNRRLLKNELPYTDADQLTFQIWGAKEQKIEKKNRSSVTSGTPSNLVYV